MGDAHGAGDQKLIERVTFRPRLAVGRTLKRARSSGTSSQAGPRSDEATRNPVDPRASIDPVVEAYKRHVDRSLLRENLKLTPDQRLRNLSAFMRSLQEVQAAGAARRPKDLEVIAELEALKEERDRGGA